MKTMSITPGNTAEPNEPPSPSQYMGSMTEAGPTTPVVTAAN